MTTIQTAGPDMADQHPAGLRRSWIALATLCLGMMVSYVDRMLLAAVTYPIKMEFGLSDSQIGLMTGLGFGLFYSVMVLPLGWLSDRVSRRKIIVVCIILWSAVTTLTGFARSYAELFITRMAVAIGEAGFSPAANSLISDLFPPRFRNIAYGLFLAGAMLGTTVGFIGGGAIAASYGWRSAFYIMGIPGIILGVLVWFLVYDPPVGAWEEQKASLTSSWLGTMATLRKNRIYVMLVTANSLHTIGLYGIIQWMPQFLIRSHGISPDDIGWISGLIVGLGMFGGQIIGGVLGFRLAFRSAAAAVRFCVFSEIIIVGCYIAALYIPYLPVVLLFLFIGSIFTAAATPPATAATYNVVAPGMRGTASSVLTLSVAIIGMGLGPTIIGVMSDLFEPFAGNDALRYSLVAIQLAAVVSGYLFIRSARMIARS